MSLGPVAKHAVKRTGSRILRFAQRFRLSNGVIFLCYHRVGEEPDCLNMQIPVEQFAAQMEFLEEEFEIVSFDRAVENLHRGTVAGVQFAISFDDGFSDNLLAVDVLREKNVRPVLFVTVNAIDRKEGFWFEKVRALYESDGTRLLQALGAKSISESLDRLKELPSRERMTVLKDLGGKLRNSDEAEAQTLSWEILRRLQDEAAAIIGSHGLQHESLHHMNSVEQLAELRDSRKRIECQTRAPVRFYAFPNGGKLDIPEGSDALVQSAGYEHAFSLQPAWHRSAQILLGRVCVTRDFAGWRGGFDKDLFVFNLFRTAFARS